MGRLLILFCSMVFCCSSVTSMAAAPPAGPGWNPDETAPTTDAVASAAAHARAIHCKTPSCRAIIVIHELTGIVIFEIGDANGVASLYTGCRPAIAGHRLDRVLLDRPDLYAPVCATGAKLISRFRLTPAVYEMIVPVQLLVNAVDMDLRDHGHCAQELLAALPKNPANDEVRFNAESLCDSNSENHHRPRAACDVLIQGLKAGR